MLPVLQAAQMRCDHGTDGAGIGGAVSMAAYVPVNGTDVQASAAANTMERVALFRIGEKFSAAIVQEHHMVFIRAVRFSGLPRPAIHGVVTGDGLAGSCGRQHRKEEGKVLHAGEDLLD